MFKRLLSASAKNGTYTESEENRESFVTRDKNQMSSCATSTYGHCQLTTGVNVKCFWENLNRSIIESSCLCQCNLLQTPQTTRNCEANQAHLLEQLRHLGKMCSSNVAVGMLTAQKANFNIDKPIRTKICWSWACWQCHAGPGLAYRYQLEYPEEGCHGYRASP